LKSALARTRVVPILPIQAWQLFCEDLQGLGIRVTDGNRRTMHSCFGNEFPVARTNRVDLDVIVQEHIASGGSQSRITRDGQRDTV
jgi:hypothetical protein